MRPYPVSPAAARPSGRWLVLASLGAVLAQGPAPLARAASQTVTGPLNLSAAVDLQFSIAIDKFMFLRIGDGAWPTPGGTVSTASFVVNPSIPAAPTTPTNGSNKAVNWSGAVPAFSVTASGNVLPVEVRSNAGQVRLYATVTTPLSNGAQTIPMSHLTVSSDQATLPAPVLPATGTGTSVNVTGGGTGAINSLVTLRSANWTFALPASNAATYAAGQYSGQLTFTASAP